MKAKKLIFLFSCLALGFSSLWAQDSLNISMVGRIDYWDQPYGTAVCDDYLLVAVSQAGLRVLDVSDPSQIEEVWSRMAHDHAFDVVVYENLAFVCDGGLYILDLANPASPEELDYLDYTSFGFGVRGVAVDDEYAYCVGSQEMSIVSLADLNNLEILSNISLGGGTYSSAVINGDYLYASYYGDEFIVVDVTDRYNPIEVLTYNDVNGEGMVMSDSMLYVAGENGLFIFSVSNPAAPHLVNTYNPMSYNDVDVDNGIAYLAAGEYGLHLLNVSNPNYPFEVSSFDNSTDYASRISVK